METKSTTRRHCKRCNGTGDSGHIPEFGLCYGCNGHGYIPSAVDIARLLASTKAREIAARTLEVAQARANVEAARAGWARRAAETVLARALESLGQVSR